MSQKGLYIIIIFLGGFILYLLFVPADVDTQPTNIQEESSVDTEVATSTKQEIIEDAAVPEDENEDIVLEGVFIGLVDGENVHKQKFKYLLLDDGLEVLRIDLRPLLQYDVRDITQKLGVERSERVEVTGHMQDDVFVVVSIEAAEQ